MKGLKLRFVTSTILALVIGLSFQAAHSLAEPGGETSKDVDSKARELRDRYSRLLGVELPIMIDGGFWITPTEEKRPALPPQVDAAAQKASDIKVTAEKTPAKDADDAAAKPRRIVNRNPEKLAPKFYPESMFTLYKKGMGTGPTLLIVGGIQGDEPGGFTAASLIATHYRVTKGSVWIVPDLNFPSILQRKRGLHGDMNRKFSTLPEKDPEYAAVKEIKDILLADEVDIILNLHDGSGFYRHEHIDDKHSPKRWGQCVIIDQSVMEAPRFSNLEELAQTACEDVNKKLLKQEHFYSIRNTHTADGDKEMEKSLSYFAMRNGKPAFGIEASKEFTTEYRTYYHLQVLESFMNQMGIEFERTFDLNPRGVLTAMNSDLKLALYKDRLVFPLENIRPSLAMIPFRKGTEVEAESSRPLLALVQEDKLWRIAYGNRTLTFIKPDYMDFDDGLAAVEVTIDGKKQTVRMGDVISVNKSFNVAGIPGYRVNAIGAKKEKNGTESDVELGRADFHKRFSVDKSGTLYRVEVYKDKAFAGMVLVRFEGKGAPAASDPLTATNGPESDFGY